MKFRPALTSCALHLDRATGLAALASYILLQGEFQLCSMPAQSHVHVMLKVYLFPNHTLELWCILCVQPVDAPAILWHRVLMHLT